MHHILCSDNRIAYILNINYYQVRSCLKTKLLMSFPIRMSRRHLADILALAPVQVYTSKKSCVCIFLLNCLHGQTISYHNLNTKVEFTAVQLEIAKKHRSHPNQFFFPRSDTMSRCGVSLRTRHSVTSAGDAQQPLRAGEGAARLIRCECACYRVGFQAT